MKSIRDTYLVNAGSGRPDKKALDELVLEGLNADKYSTSQYEDEDEEVNSSILVPNSVQIISISRRSVVLDAVYLM